MSEVVVSRAAKYGRVPVSVLCRPGVSGDECRLYAYLTTFDFKLKGEVWPGRERAAHDLGWSVRKLDGVLQALAEHDAIARIQAGNGRPARIELLADVVRDAALQDLAALPDHVDSPAKAGNRTSSRTRKEPEDASKDEELTERDREVAAATIQAVRARHGFVSPADREEMAS